MLTYQEAKKIMGQNFLGPDELSCAAPLNLAVPKKIPLVPFSAAQLKKYRSDFILVLGCAKDEEGKWLTLNRFREVLGVDPAKSEPRMYNQDWYVREKFAAKIHLATAWYLIRKEVHASTKGKDPKILAKKFSKAEQLPTAILTAYTFFVYYFARKKILWKHDFLWCRDRDHNGDQIYTGRYVDPTGTNKNGFNIHRHLSIRKVYAVASEIIL